MEVFECLGIVIILKVHVYEGKYLYAVDNAWSIDTA